ADGPPSTRLDGMTARAGATRIHPAMPFARGAAPLVSDRAPLVLGQGRERALVVPPAAACELAVGHDRATHRCEHRARLQEHLLVLGLRVGGGDDRAARADLQPV